MPRSKKDKSTFITGRGAQINTSNPFHTTQLDGEGHGWRHDDDVDLISKTKYIPTHPKSILNKVKSPDLRFAYSINPYQGCEHGCVYCYARNTHTFWGYSAGVDFEQKILIKQNVAPLLEQKLKSKSWEPQTIMVSGNTDCYQPAERKYRITRSILEVLHKYKHPASIITKNALILRDLDLLTEMAKDNTVRVILSITSLNEELRSLLEPRTSSSHNRLKTVAKLSSAGIPVRVMIAPIIPSLTDHEISDIAKAAAEAGAQDIGYTIVRLNGDVGPIFKDWLLRTYPDRYDRVIHQIEICHGGKVNDSRFGTRMRGEGQFADIIKQQIQLARSQYFKGPKPPPLSTEHFEKIKNPQLKLF